MYEIGAALRTAAARFGNTSLFYNPIYAGVIIILLLAIVFAMTAVNGKPVFRTWFYAVLVTLVALFVHDSAITCRGSDCNMFGVDEFHPESVPVKPSDDLEKLVEEVTGKAEPAVVGAPAYLGTPVVGTTYGSVPPRSVPTSEAPTAPCVAPPRSTAPSVAGDTGGGGVPIIGPAQIRYA
jgi:hypothetical protein